MRRTDREITDWKEMVAVMGKCTVCHLGFFDRDYPYVVPVNFGFVVDGEQIALYLHGAYTGKKMALLRENDHVAFCLVCGDQLKRGKHACAFSMAYESVCGNGRLELVEQDEEKRTGLCAIMRQIGEERDDFDHRMVERTAVLRLQVHKIWGKRHGE